MNIVVQNNETTKNTSPPDPNHLFNKRYVPFQYLSDLYMCLKELPQSISKQDRSIRCVYSLCSNAKENMFISYQPGHSMPERFTQKTIGSWSVESPLRTDISVLIYLVEYSEQSVITDILLTQTSYKRSFTWLVEEWSFLYKQKITYYLSKYSEGYTKEEACKNGVHYHVCLRTMSPDTVKNALFKMVDFFQCYETSIDRRKQVLKSCVYKTLKL